MVLTVAIASLLLTGGQQSRVDQPIKPVAATTVDGKKVTIPDPKATATVLVFLLTDCPIANRYAPELKRIETDYAKKNVAFYRVYVYDEATKEQIDEHTRLFDYKWPAVHDKSKALIGAVDARVTPEVAVIKPDGSVVYMGRIDDMYVEHGRLREGAYRRDLRVALDETLAGKAVSLPRTTALGCYIER
jgi:hypothetical protein